MGREEFPGEGEVGRLAAVVGEVGAEVNVAVGGTVAVNVALGSGDAVKVGMGVFVCPAGWKAVGVAAFGSRVGNKNGANGNGVGVGVGAAQATRKAMRNA